MDVPELTDEFVEMVGGQCDEQAGPLGPRDLERIRDDNLIGIIRSLKHANWGAGKVANTHQAALRPTTDSNLPMETVRQVIPVGWTDYNGHMNEARYGQIFSDAADAVMINIGADADYIADGNSYFTAENVIKFLMKRRQASQFMSAPW